MSWLHRLMANYYGSYACVPTRRFLQARLLATLGPSFFYKLKILQLNNGGRKTWHELYLRRKQALHIGNLQRSNKPNKVLTQGTQVSSANRDKNIYSFYDTQLSEEDCTALLEALTEQENKRLQVLKLEFQMIEMEGHPTPEHVSDKLWVHIFHNSVDVTERINFYKLLFIREEARKAQAQIRKEDSIQFKARQNALQRDLESTGDLHPNTIHLPILRRHKVEYEDSNLAYAMQFNPTVCFDFSFEAHMAAPECVKTVNQMVHAHALNRSVREPFHVHLCNINRNSFCYKRLNIQFPKLENIPISITKDSYLNYYPKDKLVYLSPFAWEELRDFDPNDIYVFGAASNIVKMKSKIQAITKREGIRHLKLPVGRYLKRSNQRSFFLRLDQNIKTLLDRRAKKSWTESLQHVKDGKLRQAF